MSHIVVALIRHRGMAYPDSSMEFPLLVGLLCVAHKWMYSYQGVMDMLVLNNLGRVLFQFFYDSPEATWPAYVQTIQ